MRLTGWTLTLAVCLAMHAYAEDLPTPLPTFALHPPGDTRNEPFWKGLYFGSDAFVIGSKGLKSQLGGDSYIGYDKSFSNNLQLDVRASTGYLPSLVPKTGLSGYDYADSSFKLAYDMGRLTPFVTAGGLIAKPSFNSYAYSNTTNSLNDLLNPSSSTKTFGHVGAGFNYAINSNLSVGMSFSVGQRPGFPSLWP